MINRIFNIRALILMNLLNLLQKKENAWQASHFISFPQTHLINSIKYEHSYKILYFTLKCFPYLDLWQYIRCISELFPLFL